MSPNSRGSSVIDFAYELKALVPEINAALTEAFHPLGLTCVQADALMALRASGPVTLKELAGLIVAEAGHPSRLAGRLEQAGLVRREASTVDRRAIEISLTPAGLELAEQAEQARAPLAEALASRYGDQINELTGFLRRVRQDLADRGDQS